MRKLALIILVLMASRSFATDEKEHWFCTDDNSFKQGNLYAVCGVGTYSTEGEARIKALDHAMTEFQILCKHDEHCKNHKTSVEPKRTTCFENKNVSSMQKYTCHRLLMFTVSN